LIIGVVFIHAYSTEVFVANGAFGVTNTGYWADFIRNIISEGIARIAVPLFFLISGYLFFCGFSFSTENYLKKIKSRINSLLIPFVFFNVATLLFLGLLQNLTLTRALFSGNSPPISSLGMYGYLNAIFGIDRLPISYQFWFIRDLMIIVLVTPLINLFLKAVPRLFIFIILTLWFIKIWPISMPAAASVCFFSIGAYMANSKINLFALDRYGHAILPIYIAVLVTDALVKDGTISVYVHNIGIVTGIVSALYATKYLLNTNQLKQILLWASGCSFFVFAVHEPLLTAVRKISYAFIQPKDDIIIIVLYFLNPSLVIIMSVAIYVAIRILAPKFLSSITGSR
jgi:surface polysaccharide O-acyltransferase-like enzyme